MKKIIEAKVVKQVEIGPQVYKTEVYVPELASITLPGQFAQLKVKGAQQPLLRRPISVADVDGDAKTLTFIYKVLGEGTQALSLVQVGEYLDIVGPLGNGFNLTAKKPLLVGGGLGIAPLIYLSRVFCGLNTEVLLAGRSAQELFWQDLFTATCKQIHITTDDGSLGVQGNALALLPELLASGKYDAVYTCGPVKMMQGVAKLAIEQGIPCQVSLEKYMACGIGACLSCSCATKSGKRVKVCTDGPVFPAEEVIEWD